MKKQIMKEETLKKFCQFLNLYLEDMEGCRLFLGLENDVIGLFKDNTIKISLLNERITGTYLEENNNGVINYEITSITPNATYSRITGSITTKDSKDVAVEFVMYDSNNNKVLKMLTGTSDDYFYVKDYQTREVSCMLRSTPKTGAYLKHITKEPTEKVWSTYMEIATSKIDSNTISFIYESTIPQTKNKGRTAITTNEFIDFGNIANRINPRMQHFLKEIRSSLELSQINLFDQAITTSLNSEKTNELGSLFRINFKKEQKSKQEKVKMMYSTIQ